MPEIAILFCDQVASTDLMVRLGDRLADELRRDLFEVLTTAVEVFRGEVVKFTGDGLMAVFRGSPGEALHCAVRMQRGVERLAARDRTIGLALTVGLARGEAIEGGDGDWYGAAVNLAARLCATATAGQILVSDGAAADLTASLVPAGDLSLKGFPAPVSTSLLQWEKPQVAGVVPLPTALDTDGMLPFVGRALPCEHIGRALTIAQDGGRGIALVGGPPGSGVSRVLAEAASQAERRGATVLYGRCGGDDPMGAVTAALRGFIAAAPPDVLAEIAEIDGPRLSALIPLFGLRTGIAPTALGGVWPPARSIDLLLTHAARQAPILLVLDQVETAGAQEIDVLLELLTSPTPGRLLVLVGHRSGPGHGETLVPFERLVDKVRDLPGTTNVELGPFARTDVEELVRQSFGLVDPSDVSHLADHAFQVSGGIAAAVADAVGMLHDEWEELDRGDPAWREQARRILARACPYKGLVPFRGDDAGLFYGRERLAEVLVAAVSAHPFTAVVGASGSGKSSLVAAGVLPALALSDRAVWTSVSFTPGAAPMAALASALSFAGGRSLEATLDVLLADPMGAVEGVGGGGRTCLFIDQFEEVFSLCEDGTERRRFLDLVVDIAARGGDRAVVVVALRGDYFGHGAEHAGFARLLQDHTVLVGPMNASEMHAAIERPARDAGLQVEQGFADVVVADLSHRPGNLPLLSHALLETWRRRRGASITLAAYREAGGVLGAIARSADLVFEGMDAQDQMVAHDLFLRLATVNDDGEPMARPVHRQELVTEGADLDAIGRVTSVLSDNRLVIVDSDTVEVAHEALLREWPRLRTWIDEDREQLQQITRLGGAARDWVRAGRRDADLYRGHRLEAALELRSTGVGLNEGEREFLDASASQRDAEAEAQARTALRLRRRLRAVAAALVVAILAGGLAVGAARRAGRESSRANAEAAVAERSSSISLSRQLAANAGEAVRVKQVDRALLLAAEAVRVDPNAEARGSLFETLGASQPATRFLHGLSGTVSQIAVSNDAARVAGADSEGNVVIWDGNGRVVRQLASTDLFAMSGPGGPLPVDLLVDPTGRHLAAVRRSPITPEIALVDLRDGTVGGRLEREVFSPELSLVNGSINASFSSAGSELILHGDTAFGVFDVGGDSFGDLRLYPYPLGISAGAMGQGAISPDGSLLVAVDADGMSVWDTARPQSPPSWQLPAEQTGAWLLAFSGPRTVRSISAQGEVWVWDLRGRKADGERRIDPSPSPSADPNAPPDLAVRVVAADAGLSSVVVGDDSGIFSVADTATGRTISVVPVGVDSVLALTSRFVVVSDPTWGPLLSLVTVANPSGEDRTELQRANGSEVTALSADGTVAASSVDSIRAVQLHDTATGRVLHAPPPSVARYVGGPLHVALSPDGAYAVATEATDTAAVWAVRTGRQVGPSIRARGEIVALAVSNGGRTVALVSHQDGAAGMLGVADTRSGSQTWARCGTCYSALALAPKGDLVAVAQDSEVVIRRTSDLHVTEPHLEFPASSLWFSADATMVAAIDDTRGRFEVWRRGGTRPTRILEGSSLPVNSTAGIAFSNDGKTLATATTSGASLWDLGSGRQLAGELASRPPTATVETASVPNTVSFPKIVKYPVAFADGDSRVLWIPQPTSGLPENPVVARAEIRLDRLRTRACRRANRQLTAAEIRQYFGSTSITPAGCR